MFETFSASLTPILILFSCLLVGFLLRKANLLPENSDTVLSRLETYALAPVLSFTSFLRYCTIESLSKDYIIVLYAVVAVLLALAIAIPLSYAFRIKDTYMRGIYQYALTFGNFGFMGNAIVPMILGSEEHLYYYLLFTLPFSFVIYMWGLPIMTPKEQRKGSLIKNVFNLPMVAIFLGIVAGISGINAYLPPFVNGALDSLKNCMGPIAMVLAGFVIGGFSFRDLLTNQRAYVASFLRLFILPAILLGILKLLGAENYVLTLAFFTFATPLGLNTVVFPASFGCDTKPGASMAMISHALSVISLPLMYSLLCTFLG